MFTFIFCFLFFIYGLSFFLSFIFYYLLLLFIYYYLSIFIFHFSFFIVFSRFRPLQVLPKSITLFTDALVSLERIESLVFEAEKYDKNLFSCNKFANNVNDSISDDDDSDNGDDDINSIQNIQNTSNYDNINSNNNNDNSNRNNNNRNDNNRNNKTGIILKNVTAVRSKDTIILRNISFSLKSSGLVLIVGGNASGKTSLLLSVLNELHFTIGEASIKPNEVTRTLSKIIVFCAVYFNIVFITVILLYFILLHSTLFYFILLFLNCDQIQTFLLQRLICLFVC